jgi:putative acyl-CoA dehydrogenase
LQHELADTQSLEARARSITEQMAVLLQASCLIRAGHSAVADTFCTARLARGTHEYCFGTLQANAPYEQILERAF